MSCKNRNSFKVASILLIGAFSFGLSISCANAHKKETIKVSAEESDGTWTLTDGSLKFQYTDWQSNGYVKETNQIMVYGHGDGTFDISYELLGDPPGATVSGTEYIADKTIQLIDGYWTPSETGGYGTVTGFPVNVNGLDSSVSITLNINVEYSGTMNEQGSGSSSGSIYYDSGGFYQEGGGSDALVLSTIKFYGDISYENGSADLVFINTGGDNVGTLRMSPIEFSPIPEGDGSYYSGNISGTLEATSQQVENYYSNGARFWDEEVFNPNSVTWDWDGNNSVYSYDYISASTGTITTYKAAFLPPSGASGVDQIICEYTPGSVVANVRTTIYNDNNGDPIETGMTKNFEFPLSDEPYLDGDRYIFQFYTTVTYSFSIDAIYVSIVEEPTTGGEELTFVILNTHELELVEGAIGELSYQFSPSSYVGTFDWHSNNENIVTVSDKGGYAEVTAVVSGTATISITSAEYPSISDECVVTVNEQSDPGAGDQIKGVSLSEESINLFVGGTATLTYTPIPSTASGDFRWATSNVSIATVENGTVVAVAPGEATITIEYINNINIYDTCRVVVSQKSVPTLESLSITIDQEVVSETNCEAGNSIQFGYSVSPSDAEVELTWSSSDEYVGTIGQYGYFESNKAGTTIITLFDSISETSVTCSVEVIGGQTEEGLVYDPDHYCFTYASAESDSYTIELSGKTFFHSNETNGDNAYLLFNVMNSGSVVRTVDAFIENAQLGTTMSTEGGEQYVITGNWSNSLSQTVGVELRFDTPPEEINQGLNYSPKNGKFLYAISSNRNDIFLATDTSATYVSDNGGSVTIYFDDISDTATITGCELGYEEDHYVVFGQYDGFDGNITVALSSGTEIDGVYKISFDANGGTGSMNTAVIPAGVEMQFGCNYTRENYVFDGWAVDSADSTTIIDVESTLLVNKDYVLYAHWKSTTVEYTYIVSFDGNGATSGSTESVVLSGESYSQTIVFPECGYKKEGYEFVGWGFTSDALIKFQPGTEKNDITADTTVYAIWVQTFTISFDANGGTGTMENVTVPKGTATMPECKFSKEGYTFNGWAVGSPQGDVYQVGDKVTVSANYVLYATWKAITPITEIEISVAESEVVLYVDESYIVQYTVTPKDAASELIWEVEDEKVAAVIEDGRLVGLSLGSTTVTISDRSGNTSVSFVVYVVEKPVPVQPENPISEETIENISNAMDNMELSGEQAEKIQNVISENQEYISDEAGDIIYQALLGTTISSDDPVVAEAQKELVVAVVEAGVAVDAGKATNISGAQTIDKALPENANFSVEGEIQEFYERQMAELFGGEKPTRSISRAGTPTHGIDTDTKGKEGQEAVDYLANEQLLYKKMGDFVESGVDHMGKAALKLRKCSGEAVTVQVKSYVTRVKVSSFRDFDKEAADKEFVEAAYKAILLSMQNEVISILEKEHKPSNNAEKEAQYTKELEAVKDIESFEIMVTEVLRQKYVTLTGENIEDVDAFQPIYWEIFSAWALDKPSPYGISLEELTQTTIEQSTSRARTFTIESNLSAGEWGFIAGVAGGAALIIAAAAVIPTLLKKKKEKEGIN